MASATGGHRMWQTQGLADPRPSRPRHPSRDGSELEPGVGESQPGWSLGSRPLREVCCLGTLRGSDWGFVKQFLGQRRPERLGDPGRKPRLRWDTGPAGGRRSRRVPAAVLGVRPAPGPIREPGTSGCAEEPSGRGLSVGARHPPHPVPSDVLTLVPGGTAGSGQAQG